MVPLKCVLIHEDTTGNRPNVGAYPDSYSALAQLGELSWKPNVVILRPGRDGSEEERLTLKEWLDWIPANS